jgi:MoaA/NifB/PqqE/SkfB family radical SAM enzyme
MVGGVEGYASVRNRALENLVNAGFNEPNPTRLAICSNPITRDNYDEILDIYVYARERNIYPVTAALMVSGKQFNDAFLRQVDVSDEQKVHLWTRVYSWNIEHGIQTLAQIKEEGVSVLPGMHPCNQIAVGMYLTITGNVTICPGYNTVIGNVRKEKLADIWKRHMEGDGKKFLGEFNCKCPPKDGKTIPGQLYDEVLGKLESQFGTSSAPSICLFQ